jgi:Zn-finger nucleic acid-binding protein
MQCPKCTGAMEQVAFDTVTVDRCTQCAGIWFDAGELKVLQSAKGAEKLDTGTVAEGRKQNQITRINCPRCNVEMKETVDTDQHHIHLETCPQCKGAWLDAGEFADLKSYTIADYVRGLFKHKAKK